MNVTRRQEVGGSSIEASQIAGRTDVRMTAEYTHVVMERQSELTCRIQGQLEGAAEKVEQERKQQQAMAAASTDDLERFVRGLTGKGTV